MTQKEFQRRVSPEEIKLSFVLTESQIKKLKRVKELSSHVLPEGGWNEVFEYLADYFLKHKDPLLKNRTKPSNCSMDSQMDVYSGSSNGTGSKTNTEIRTESGIGMKNGLTAKVKSDTKSNSQPGLKAVSKTANKNKFSGNSLMTQSFYSKQAFDLKQRRPIPAKIRRKVFQRDHGQCQWLGLNSQICGSRYQVEVDHILAVSKGGGNELENLRLLCRQHNLHRLHCGV